MHGSPTNSYRAPSRPRWRRASSRPRAAVPPSAGVRPVLDGIRRLVRSLRLSAQKAQSQVGISGAQLFVLQSLAETAGQTITELAARTATDPSSVSVVVARLSRRRLVARHVDRRDRRCVRLGLTARGRALARKGPAAAQRELVRAVDALSRSDQAALAELIERIVAGMGEISPSLFFEEEPDGKDGVRG